MKDQHGRSIEYLRISVTDRCNLRCIYCMPEDGVTFRPHEQMLTYEEIHRIVKNAAKLGISKIRLTGGEPLVRKNLTDLIGKIKKTPGIKEVCLTTNGMLLEKYMDQLIIAGLDRINISLDTLDPKAYKKITRNGDLNKVLEGIKQSVKNFRKVKINAVIIKGRNEDQIMEFVRLAETIPVDVRFIELMPIGQGKGYQGFTSDEIKAIIQKEREIMPYIQNDKHAGPATYIKTEKSKGKIGFISPISHEFCSQCNRIRLTAEGYLKLCLHWKDGIDLKTPLRGEITDDELLQLMATSIQKKPGNHHFLNQEPTADTRIMSQIGG